jgi:hypothetical protein
MPNIISYSLYPRYKWTGKHLLPVVQEAACRILYDDSSTSMTVISAAAYEAATGAETDALCAALDRHPRERR